MPIFIKNTLVLALKISKISKSGVGVYFGTPCYGYALSKDYLFYLHATSKHEIHICSNKHETGLVYDMRMSSIHCSAD